MKMNGRRFLVVLGGVILFSNLVVAQSAPQTALDFEFSVMAWERMRDVGYAQIKTEARSKPRPVAADFEILPLRISSQDDALTVTVLDDSPAAFPGQHVRVVNLAEEPIQGTIDGQTFRVDTTRATLAPRRVGENARIGVAFERQGRPIVVFDQSLRVGAEERVMLVFLPPFREGADVRVRVVRDQVFEPAEP